MMAPTLVNGATKLFQGKNLPFKQIFHRTGLCNFLLYISIPLKLPFMCEYGVCFMYHGFIGENEKYWKSDTLKGWIGLSKLKCKPIKCNLVCTSIRVHAFGRGEDKLDRRGEENFDGKENTF